MALNSKVITLHEAENAALLAHLEWFNYFMHLFASFKEATNPKRQRMVGYSFAPDNPLDGHFWQSNPDVFSDMVARSLMDPTGSPDIWVTYFQSPFVWSGPYRFAYRNYLSKLLESKALFQGKPRKSGVWRSRDGEKNRLILRVPHR